MRTVLALMNRNRKLFFKDKGMLFTAMITPVSESSYSSYMSIANDEWSNIALKLLSIFDYISYEILGGEEPEIFIRLNDPQKVKNIVLGNTFYSNNYVNRAKQKHDRDVSVLLKFFNGLNTDKERWDYIEDYFLGYDVLCESETVVKLLRMLTGDKYGYDYSDIVILTLKTESESIMNNISKISGIPITREKSKSSILFTTAKKFKGLESRVIIIVDIDESSFNDEKEKRNFYVACSRATQYLSLIVEGNDQKIKSIADVIAGPNFAPKGKIAMKTQATPLRLD